MRAYAPMQQIYLKIYKQTHLKLIMNTLTRYIGSTTCYLLLLQCIYFIYIYFINNMHNNPQYTHDKIQAYLSSFLNTHSASNLPQISCIQFRQHKFIIQNVSKNV